MAISPHETLPVLFENRLPDPVNVGLIDYCDVHDLIALVPSRTQNVSVYRINGQLAFQIHRKDGEHDVAVLKWKPDGSLLGVGWSDGTVGLYSGEDGKVIGFCFGRRNGVRDDWRLDLRAEDGDVDGDGGEVSTPALVGWTTYATESRQPIVNGKRDTRHLRSETWDDATDDLSAPHSVANGKGSLSRLTKSIATLDISTVLPRLSALPVHALRFGPNEQKFTTQAGLDAILDVNPATSDCVNTFLTSSTSGHTNVYLGDSVSLGASTVGPQDASSKLASHPLCTSQAILSSPAPKDHQPFRLNYIDLPLAAMNEPLLHIVTTNTKRIQSLLSYITQTVRCMQSDLTANLQLPSRLIELFNEDLTDPTAEDDLLTSLYHLALTGDFAHPTVETWFSDIGDNKHKRWDKHVNDMYNHLEAHIFINLIPALDRLAIATDAIGGHAKAREGTDTFVSPAPFANLMDDIDALRLTAQKLQLLVMTEHRQFRAFSRWVRVMVDIALAGPGEKEAVAIEQREAPHLDVCLVLAYIKDTLMQSKVTSYLQQDTALKGTCARDEFWQHPAVVRSTRANIVQAINTLNAGDGEPGDDAEATGLLSLPSLAVRLVGQARLAIESITTWQSEMLPKPIVTILDPAELAPEATILDFKMRPNTDGRFGADGTIHILSTTTSSSRKSSQMALLSVSRTSLGQTETSNQTLPLPPGELLDAKMLDNRCLVLLKQADEARSVILSYELQSSSGRDVEGLELLHVFMDEDSFEPERFAIGGRKGKMVCVVFGKDGLVWKVLDVEPSGGTALAAGEDEMAF